jgi:hypothetical protein
MFRLVSWWCGSASLVGHWPFFALYTRSVHRLP